MWLVLCSALVAAAPHRVVIDPGHGGSDTGARAPFGAMEKNLVLKISLELSRFLSAAGVEVVLTRRDDHFITLKERTNLANQERADLFVSIHANTVTVPHASGVETYYLNTTSNRYALKLAAVENHTSEQEVGALQLILADLSKKASTKESMRAARLVQRFAVGQAQAVNREARDHGVKASLFYVLLGAEMPSILVETGFLSNLREARLLNSRAYQVAMARAIGEAVLAYFGRGDLPSG